ncbi:LAETG motif-containing sortase-dependent surface protein [Streptomyces sp. NPDC056084]|uniref:LAETG motif-containing sortase-dependent surface protein n=1 Tax=unclassified Streptomyces TaxID=2593676 RepID=UPI0035DD4465
MVSKRSLVCTAASAVGVVLLASGSAQACSIGDFTAKATCDTSTGEARAAITVTDKDPSGTPADITVRIRMASGFDGETLGTGHIEHPTAAGARTTILVPWLSGYQWNVSVTAGNLTDERLTNLPISPDAPCTPAASPSSGASSKPVHSASPTTTAKPDSSAAAPVAAASSAPSAAPSSAATGTALAETGGGSDTALIAGSAAAIIAAGAGVLSVLRRRTAAGRH